MNQKELGELRRRFRPDKHNITHVYGCFVNANKDVIAEIEESLNYMTPEEVEKYLGLLKRAMSGTLGRNLIDIEFLFKEGLGITFFIRVSVSVEFVRTTHTKHFQLQTIFLFVSFFDKFFFLSLVFQLFQTEIE